MQALILAGGEGTRLRPLTSTVPKPVIPLANRPFISYMLDWLAGHGFDEVIMSCGFLAGEVRAVLGEGGHDGIRIRYVEEPDARGTAGAVKYAEEMLDSRFAVLNGDVLTDFDLSSLTRAHEECGALATLALIRVEDPSAYGLVTTEADGRVKEFLEKPEQGQVVSAPLINAGAYVLEREVLDSMPEGRAVSFEREVFPQLIGSGLYAREVHGYWLDIGTPQRYLEATRDILSGTVTTEVGRALELGRVGIPNEVVIGGVELRAPVLIAGGCEIAPGAQLGPFAVLGEGCRVGDGVSVRNAVLLDGCELGPEVSALDAVVGSGARIGSGARLSRETIVGAGVIVEPGARLEGRRVEPGSVPELE